MQDLTHDAQTGAKAYLSPSSMQGGNTVADEQGLAMTAPGSVSILPVPDKIDVLPMPKFTNDGQIPVSHPGSRERVTAQSANAGGGRFTDMHDVPAASLWKETK